MLDNKCPSCGGDLDTGFNCPVCSKKTIMKTPTKEQIEHITKECLRKGGSTWTFQKIAELVIWEWEKIRNSDSKKTIGTDDYMKFYEQIREDNK